MIQRTYSERVSRQRRTAPARNFNGGTVNHGPIQPMDAPSLVERILKRLS